MSCKMTKNPKKSKAPSQRARFIEAARELGCDDDKDAFEAKLKRLAKAKPKKEASAK